MLRINFLFILIILLTACSPVNSSLTPESEDATAIVIININQEPVGFGETPGSTEVNSDSFIPPSKENANIKLGVESPIPPELASTVKQYKEAMNAIKVEVAEVCAVAVKDLIPVFKSNNLSGDQYRWTVVFEAGNYTCWSSTLSNGVMGQYPTYFHMDNGNILILSKADGVGWERVEGGWMDFTGIHPIIVFENGYVNPNGEILSVIYDDITPFGQVVSVKENPIPKLSMDNLIKAGYVWNGNRGILEDSNGEPFLTLKGDNWLATDGIEFATESYKPLAVNGVDDKGMPVYVINSRVIKDKNGKEHTELYVEKTGEWRSTVGYEPGSTTETDKNKWNVVTMDDVTSGFLRELKLAQQYKWQENAVNPNWYVSFVGGSRSGAMQLTPYGVGFDEYKDKIFPTSPVDMYWIQSPSDPTKKIVLGLSQNKGPNGEDIVFATAFGDQQVNRGGITGFLSENNAALTYLVGLDKHDCENASLIANSDSAFIKESCVFWPKTDSRWDRVSWDFILNGADYGTKWVSDPLTAKFVAQYQDDVMISLLGYFFSL